MIYLAFYYKEIKETYDKVEKYYLIDISDDNSYAMYNLATRYYKENNYDEMKKYYYMAIDKGNSTAIIFLEKYYNDNNLHVDKIPNGVLSSPFI